MQQRFTTAAACRAVAASAVGRYGVLPAHGTLQPGYYAPQQTDPRQAYARDEIYIVQCGHGRFVPGDERRPFAAGEALFVPAGTRHRFEYFSPDFAPRVVFAAPPAR